MADVGTESSGRGEMSFGSSRLRETLPPGIKEKGRGEFNRTEITTAFKSAYTRCESSVKDILDRNHLSPTIIDRWEKGEKLNPDEENALKNLPPEEKQRLADFKVVTEGKRKTLDVGKNTFTHTYTGEDGTKYSAEEGLPVEGMLRLLRNEIQGIKEKVAKKEMTKAEADAQITAIKGEGYILYKSSNLIQRKYRVASGASAQPSSPAHARARVEAYYIYEDPLRATGNARDDFLDGIQTMQYRRELSIPADDTVHEAKKAKPRVPKTKSTSTVVQPTQGGNSAPTVATSPNSQVNQPGAAANTAPIEANPPIISTAINQSNTSGNSAPAVATSPNSQVNQPGAAVNLVSVGAEVINGSLPPAPGAVDAIVPGSTASPGTTPSPATASEVRHEVYFVNRTVEAENKAAEMAEEQLRNEMRRGNWWNPKDVFRKFKLRFAEQYYRQKYKERALKAILANDNSFLAFNCVKNELTECTKNLAGQKKVGQEKIAEIKAHETLNDEYARNNVKEATGAFRTEIIDQIIKPMVNGTMTEAQAKVLLKTFVASHQNDPDVMAVFGRDATKYREIANFFATDLAEMAEKMKGDIINHTYALEQIDQHISIKLANAEWGAQTDAHFNAVDKIVARVQGNRVLGHLINPASAGIVTSLALSLALPASKSGISRLIAPGAGSVLGGIFGGVRRWHDLTVDIASHKADRAYGLEMPQNAKQRAKIEKMMKNSHFDVTSVADLLNGGGSGKELTTGQTREGIDQLLGQDLTNADVQKKIIQRMAEIATRVDLSSSLQEDLITAQGSRDVLRALGGATEQEGLDIGRSQLVVQIVKMRMALREKGGMSEDQIKVIEDRLKGEWKTHLRLNVDQEKKAERVYKLKESAKAAVIGGVTGMVSSLATQEATALFQRGVLGMNAGETNLESIFHHAVDFAKGEHHVPIPTAGVMVEAFKNGGTVAVDNNLNLQIDKNHVAQFIDSQGHKIGPTLVEDQFGNIKTVDGSLIPKNIQDTLHNIGFNSHTEAGASLLQSNNTVEVLVDGHYKTVIPEGTAWVKDASTGKFDLVSNNGKILINNATFGNDGTMTYDHTTSLIQNLSQTSYTETGANLLSQNTPTVAAVVDGHNTMIPEGSKWVPDAHIQGKYDLVLGNKTLINDAVFAKDGTMTYDMNPGHSLLRVDMVDSTIKVNGPEGLWTKETASIDRYEWYVNNTPDSDFNELLCKTYKNGDTIRISMSEMSESWQKGLQPETISVPAALKGLLGGPDNVDSRVGVAFSLGGNLKKPLILLSDASGNLDLNPNAPPGAMIDYINSNGDVAKISLRTVSRALLNVDEIKKLGLTDGDIATEWNADIGGNLEYLKVFNVGGTGGDTTGYISTGRFVEQAGKKVWQSFATIRGTGVPTDIAGEIPSISPIDITQTKDLFETVVPIPEPFDNLVFVPPIEAPPAIPIPFVPRWPLEAMMNGFPGYLTGYEGFSFPNEGRLDGIMRRRPESGAMSINKTEAHTALAEAQEAFDRADRIYIPLGGAIGDAVVATGYISAIQEVLRKKGRNIPITLIINRDHGEIFEGLKSANLQLVKASRNQTFATAKTLANSGSENNPLIIEMESYGPGAPFIAHEVRNGHNVSTLENLLNCELTLYNNQTDGRSRYSHFIEDLFSLPKDFIGTNDAQTKIPLPDTHPTMYGGKTKQQLYNDLLTRYGIDSSRPQVSINIEASYPGKRYSMQNWIEVMKQIAVQRSDIQFNIMYNSSSTEVGYRKGDIENLINSSGLSGKVHLAPGNLVETAVLMEKQRLVLSNDTGIAHIGAALESGPEILTLFTPKSGFSPNVWCSNAKLIPITLPPREEVALPYADIRDNDERKKNINKINPGEVVRAALRLL